MNKTEPPSAAFTTTVAAIIIVFCIVGLVGNVLVILAIFRKKRLRTLPNSFIASMSVADIVYIVAGAAPGASAFVSRGWGAGIRICTVNQYVILGFCQISLLHMVCIAVSRFIHIVHYTSASRILSKRNVILALCITWLLLPVIIIPYHFFIAGEIVYLEKAFRCVTLTSDSRVGMTAFLYLICFVLPSVVVVICYVKIRMFVSKKKHQLSLHLRKNDDTKTTHTAKEAVRDRGPDDMSSEKGAGTATEAVRASGPDDTKSNEKCTGTADDQNNSITAEEKLGQQNDTTAFSNGTVIRTSSQLETTCSMNDKAGDNDFANEIGTQHSHPYVSSQNSNDILEDDSKNDNDKHVKSNDVAGTSNTRNIDESQNGVKFTEISNIKHSGDEKYVDSENDRNKRRCLGHKGNSKIKTKLSRSIRLRRLRFIRRNPHFRTISDEELQLNRMMAVVFVIIWMGYIPYPIVRFLDPNDVTVSGTVYITSTMILYVAGCLNPIVYGVMHKRFRAAFVEMLTFKLIKLSRIGIMLNDSTNSDNIDQNGSNVSKTQIRSQCA